MTGDRGGWEISHKIVDVIALVGFAIPLIDDLLQAHGIINVDPDRQTLIIGGVVAAILAAFFFYLAVRKFYFSPPGARRFHHPRWDVLAFAAFAILAAFCFMTSPAKLATPSSQHHGTASAVATREVRVGRSG
jgi:hypothetical protein